MKNQTIVLDHRNSSSYASPTASKSSKITPLRVVLGLLLIGSGGAYFWKTRYNNLAPEVSSAETTDKEPQELKQDPTHVPTQELQPVVPEIVKNNVVPAAATEALPNHEKILPLPTRAATPDNSDHDSIASNDTANTFNTEQSTSSRIPRSTSSASDAAKRPARGSLTSASSLRRQARSQRRGTSMRGIDFTKFETLCAGEYLLGRAANTKSPIYVPNNMPKTQADLDAINSNPNVLKIKTKLLRELDKMIGDKYIKLKYPVGQLTIDNQLMLYIRKVCTWQSIGNKCNKLKTL